MSNYFKKHSTSINRHLSSKIFRHHASAELQWQIAYSRSKAAFRAFGGSQDTVDTAVGGSYLAYRAANRAGSSSTAILTNPLTNEGGFLRFGDFVSGGNKNSRVFVFRNQPAPAKIGGTVNEVFPEGEIDRLVRQIPGMARGDEHFVRNNGIFVSKKINAWPGAGEHNVMIELDRSRIALWPDPLAEKMAAYNKLD